MERKITIITEDGSARTISFTSSAQTLADLKTELNEKGVNYAGKSFFEGISKTEVLTDESILPSNLPYKGGVTNDLVFMLTTPNKKITSGAGERAELLKYIKDNNLQSDILSAFGKNYTNVKSVDLEQFIADFEYKKGIEHLEEDDASKAEPSENLVDSKGLVERINSAIDTLLGVKAILTGMTCSASSDDTNFDDMFDFLK